MPPSVDSADVSLYFVRALLTVRGVGRLLMTQIGAQRGVNPALREGGDAVRTVDLSFLRQLATEFSDVKFLATVRPRHLHIGDRDATPCWCASGGPG